ncbi:MAG: hypothetical protein KFH98_07980 [Gemmatimonadetes bacterium]|nr:hypothetical protein [Gemmatimonadota bacterium]
MRYFVAALALASMTTACSDTAGPAAVISDELAGTWEAAEHCLPECGFTLQRLDNPADSINFVSSLMQTFVFTLTTSGRFGLTAPGGGTTIRGEAYMEGGTLIFRDQAGAQDTADYALTGRYLGLTFRTVTSSFDFDGDGVGDPSIVRARFEKQ